MERHPYFQIGEEVILQSIDHPSDNGIYYIENICFKENPIRYTTLEDLPASFAYELVGIEGWWGEKIIKKIHKPSQCSFENLLNEIKCPAYRILYSKS